MTLHSQLGTGVGSPYRSQFLPYGQGSALVPDKPFHARFKARLGGAQLEGNIERDFRGNSRTVIYDPVRGAPVTATVWSTREGVVRVFDYEHRLVLSFKREALAANRQGWLFEGFEAGWSNDHEMIAGKDSRKIALRPARGTEASAGGECWLSEPLSIVMRERIILPGGQRLEWDIIDVHEENPAEDILAVPAGFVEIRPPAHE